MKEKTRRSIVIVFLAFVVVMVLGACNQRQQTSAQSAGASTQRPSIRISYIGTEGYWTPYTYSSNWGFEVLKLFYDKLFYYDEDLNLKPWLVKEYQINDNYTEFTLKLHENAKWHDGKPLTAEDVAFTYEYFSEARQPRSRWTSPLRRVEKVEVLDTYTVKITTKASEFEWLRIPFTDTPIIPKHIWDNVTEPFQFDGGTGDGKSGVIGSGPYRMVECEFDSYYRFVANDDHFLVTPNLEQIEIVVFKDRNSEYSAFVARQIDMIGQNLTADVIDQFMADPSMTVGQAFGFTSTVMQANFDMYPFNVPEFNRAIAHLINYQEIIDVVWLGYADKAYPSMVHPMISYFNPNQRTYDFNIARANEILDNLGFTRRDADGIRRDDRGRRLEFVNLTNNVNTQRIRAIELMSQDFRQAGILMTVRTAETGTYNRLTAPQSQGEPWGREYEISISGPGQSYQMSDLSMGQIFYSDYYTHGTNNLTGYNNPVFDAMFLRQLNELNPERRVERHKEMQAWIAENNPPYWPLVHPLDTYAYYADVYDGYKVKAGHSILHILSFVTFNK